MASNEARRLFHIVDPELRAERRRRLEASGIDLPAAEKNGQFEMRNWADAYLREGHFDQEKMIDLIQEVLDDGRQKGSSPEPVNSKA